MLQEVFHDDLEKIETAAQTTAIFKPALLKDGIPWGNVCISRIPSQTYIAEYYVGNQDQVKEYDHFHPDQQCKSIVGTQFSYNNQFYTLLSTHFTWSPNGQPSALQRQELKQLFAVLEKYPSLVISGDFNTPRGTEIFDTISSKYIDNVPKNITSTIDGNYHKAGHLPYVVDGLFSTADYAITDVTIKDGLSDHCAITANILQNS